MGLDRYMVKNLSGDYYQLKDELESVTKYSWDRIETLCIETNDQELLQKIVESGNSVYQDIKTQALEPFSHHQELYSQNQPNVLPPLSPELEKRLDP